MYIKVRGPDSKTTEIINVSKLTAVEELKLKVQSLFDIEPDCQRLFYKGKQLENGYKIFDYNIQLNDVIQLIKKEYIQPVEESSIRADKLKTSKDDILVPSEEETVFVKNSHYYMVGDAVDYLDPSTRTWFEGKIVKILYRVGVERDILSTSSVTASDNSQQNTNNVTSTDVKCNEKVSVLANIENTMDNRKKSKSVVTSDHIKKGGNSVCEPRELVNSGLYELETPISSNKYTIEIHQMVSTSCSYEPIKDDEGNLKGFALLSINDINSSIKDIKQDIEKENISTPCGDCRIPVEDGYIYEVENLSYPQGESGMFSINELRPRAHYLLSNDELIVGETVMVNYNGEEPGKLGLWVDFIISSVANTRVQKFVEGTIIMKSEPEYKIENIKLKNSKQIYRIEHLTPITEHPNKTEISLTRIRPVPFLCDHCEDRAKRKCKECGCSTCGGKENPNRQVVCDECEYSFHFSCLDPPIQELPEEEYWYCSECKNDDKEIVKAGEKLKRSVKKENMPSQKTGNTKWGSGMANVGRTQVCTIVPANHFGPVPGIEVGTCWKFRIQVSEAGVHRPPVGGIHGRDNDGAYSIVLSGGYEDDEDNGDSFWYTGSGGRDLSGNKRTSVQSCDQLLTKTNRALALNCAAKISENGAVAKDWKKGKPVRVCRSYKAAKHSKYAPEEGIRYDGMYKVVEYKPVKGKSGFVVWRYLLRRDDISPAPWTSEGKAMMESLGLEIEIPQDYIEAMKKKTANTNGMKLSLKSDEGSIPKKRRKVVAYELGVDIKAFMAKDKLNSKLWGECRKFISEGKKKYLEAVKENFLCICCQDLVYEPVTSICGHNFCMSCMKRAYKAEVYSCPACRTDLGSKFNFIVNKNLFSILQSFFPGYGMGH